MNTPEFWLVLNEPSSDDLADRVYEAGFDDCALTTGASGAATIEIAYRWGSLAELIAAAIRQAENAGLTVARVEIPRTAFPIA
jgi:hypothetical protein